MWLTGYAEVDNVLTSGIPIRLYLRSTGEMVGNTVYTTASGSFAIETTYSGAHYAIALSPASGTNALIYDYLVP